MTKTRFFRDPVQSEEAVDKGQTEEHATNLNQSNRRDWLSHINQRRLACWLKPQ